MKNNARVMLAVGNNRSIAEAIILVACAVALAGSVVYLWLGY